MFDFILKVYRYGYDVEAIAYDVDKTTDEVVEMLRDFKNNNFFYGGKYSDELKNVIIDRFLNGVRVYQIEKELGFGKSTIRKMLIKEGFAMEKHKKYTEKDYEIINHKDFLSCPSCNSKRVNDLTEYDDEGKTNKKTKRTSYCFDCGTEWYFENGETRKVLFHLLA